MNALGPSGVAGVTANITVLAREGLIAEEWRVQSHEGQAVAEVRPSGIGAEFFLWGHGAKPITALRVIDPTTELRFLTEVPDAPNTTLINPPSLEEASSA